MLIRKEAPNDHAAVEALTRRSFYNLYVPGCVEHYLVHIMREHGDFIPELYPGAGLCSGGGWADHREHHDIAHGVDARDVGHRRLIGHNIAIPVQLPAGRAPAQWPASGPR